MPQMKEQVIMLILLAALCEKNNKQTNHLGSLFLSTNQNKVN